MLNDIKQAGTNICNIYYCQVDNFLYIKSLIINKKNSKKTKVYSKISIKALFKTQNIGNNYK